MAKTLISTHDIAVLGASATLDITSGIDDTYSVYEFHYYNMHPATNQVDWMFQVNAHDGSSQLTGFDETITSSFYYTQGGESQTGNTSYYATMDLAQSTGYCPLNYEVGSDADQSTSGILTLYDPSGTTFIKHFLSESNFAQSDDMAAAAYVGGYINTTNAITQISFKFDSGNIDAGVIKMFGVA
jgi:hypothetical protein